MICVILLHQRLFLLNHADIHGLLIQKLPLPLRDVPGAVNFILEDVLAFYIDILEVVDVGDGTRKQLLDGLSINFPLSDFFLEVVENMGLQFRLVCHYGVHGVHS